MKAKVATGSTSVLTFVSGSGGTFTIPYTMTVRILITMQVIRIVIPSIMITTQRHLRSLTNSYHVLYTTKEYCNTNQFYTVCHSTKVSANNNINCSLHVNLTNGSADLSKLPAGTYFNSKAGLPVKTPCIVMDLPIRLAAHKLLMRVDISVVRYMQYAAISFDVDMVILIIKPD